MTQALYTPEISTTLSYWYQ